ncbi:uncharacterized protein LOC106152514 [Lingula anatina]|uniref:Uncharacterized protein LOC106152514 n=1 Tax=Lingula anatina TaxID=7574 RepID=A0A1S3H7W2_LINAN|nr:uncharacterized protein LOC106152514 [Lingula anatina]|eukprot:XP_013381576.1 uncharacterized protein LOC106152514 [Lingula anatina]
MRCVVLAPLFFVSLWCATEGIIFSMLTKGKRIKRAGADRAEQVPAQRLLSDLTKHHPDRNIDKRDGNLDDTYHQGLFTDGSQVDDVNSKDAAEIAEEMRSRLKSFEARRQGEAVKSVLKEDDDLSLLDQIDSVLGAPLKKALLEVLDNEIKDTDKPSTTEKKSNSEKIDDKNNKDYPFYPENSIPNQNSDDTVKTSKVDTATRNLASFKTGVGKSRPRTRVLVAASAPLADRNAVQKKGEMSASPSQRQASTAAKNPGSDSFIAEKETQKPQTRFLVAPDRATEENRNENDAAVSSQHQQQAKVVDKKESISSSLATRGQMSHFQMRYLVAPDAPITEEKARKQEAMADHNAVQKKDEVSAAGSFVADRENQKPHTRLLVAPVHAKDEHRNENADADVSSRQQTQTAVKKKNTASNKIFRRS